MPNNFVVPQRCVRVLKRSWSDWYELTSDGRWGSMSCWLIPPGMLRKLAVCYHKPKLFLRISNMYPQRPQNHQTTWEFMSKWRCEVSFHFFSKFLRLWNGWIFFRNSRSMVRIDIDLTQRCFASTQRHRKSWCSWSNGCDRGRGTCQVITHFY